MKKLVLFVKVFLFFMLLTVNLTSCNYVFNQFNNKNDEIKPIIETIDFSSVDAYPLLKDCEQIAIRNLQKECFYKLLSKKIELSLSKKNITYLKANTDTIYVKIIVNSKGVISVKSVSNLNDIELKKAIIQSIDSLPQIKPAIKKGIPVTTAFILPIVLVTNG